MDTFMKGGYKPFEPGYAREAYPSHIHHPLIVDSEGRKHEIIYAEFRNDETYVTKEEQVIEFRHSPKGGRTHVPWRTPIDHRWDNTHKSSPTRPHGGHETGKQGSPRYHDKFNPIKNGAYDQRTMYPKPHRYGGGSSSEEEDGSDRECKDGVCRPTPMHGAKDYGSYDNKPKPKPNFSDPSYDRNPNHNRHQYPHSPPSSYPVPSIVSSHPRNDSSYDHPKPKVNFSDHKPKDNYSDPYYDKNPNHNHHQYPQSGQSPPSLYPVPSIVSSHARKDPSYDHQPKPKMNFSDHKPKDNYSDPYYDQNPNHNHHQYPQSPPSSYRVPSIVSSHSKKDTSFDHQPKPHVNFPDHKSKENYKGPYDNKIPNDNNHNYARSPPVSHTIPLVTAQPRNGAMPYTNSPPNVKPRSDHTGRNFHDQPRETINSSEAKRRYGGVTVPPVEQKYTGPTIDCRTAAEKYNGIFVPGNNF